MPLHHNTSEPEEAANLAVSRLILSAVESHPHGGAGVLGYLLLDQTGRLLAVCKTLQEVVATGRLSASQAATLARLFRNARNSRDMFIVAITCGTDGSFACSRLTLAPRNDSGGVRP
jgi:hypothetical protein